MTAAKRKICEEETQSELDVEKKNAARMDDRLSDLPEVLQLRILACLNTKRAVQTSVLSKTWVSLWTRIPVLKLNYVSGFDNFVRNILRRRDHLAKLDKLKVKGDCSAESLKSVFDYAFSHGVKQLEASIQRLFVSDSWPVSLCDSLTSLKLDAWIAPMRCPFQGSRSIILFKNLTVLYLRGAIITDVEPFSGFQVLKSLTLINCYLSTEGNESKTLKVHALRLTNLTIFNCTDVNCFDLRTPRLRFLKCTGSYSLKHDGPTVLETMEIDFEDLREKQRIHDLLSLFCTFPNVKSLTLSSAIFLLLSLFPDELVRRGSPFVELKDLTLNFSKYYCKRLFHKPLTGWFDNVTGYLLRNSPDAKFTITNLIDIEWLADDPCKYN